MVGPGLCKILGGKISACFAMTQLPSIRIFAEGFDLRASPSGKCSSSFISSLPQHSQLFQTHPCFFQPQIHHTWKVLFCFLFFSKKFCCEAVRGIVQWLERAMWIKERSFEGEQVHELKGIPQKRQIVGKRRCVPKSSTEPGFQRGKS